MVTLGVDIINKKKGYSGSSLAVYTMTVMVTNVYISYAIIVVPLSADACSISGMTTNLATNTTLSAMKIATISDCLPVPLIFQHIEEGSIKKMVLNFTGNIERL